VRGCTSVALVFRAFVCLSVGLRRCVHLLCVLIHAHPEEYSMGVYYRWAKNTRQPISLPYGACFYPNFSAGTFMLRLQS